MILRGAAKHGVKYAVSVDDELHAVDRGARCERGSQRPRFAPIDRERGVENRIPSADTRPGPGNDQRIATESRRRKGLVRVAETVEELRCRPRIPGGIRLAPDRIDTGDGSRRGVKQ